MKKEYTKPEIEIYVLDIQDIITDSSMFGAKKGDIWTNNGEDFKQK